MAQAATKSSAPSAAAQFHTRGYVLSEDAELVLMDLFSAMEATAFAYDLDQQGSSQLCVTGDQIAAVMRTWARLGRQVIVGAPFAPDAMARPRES